MQLKIALSSFFSPGDERRFFEGLAGVRGVQKFIGSGRDLIITLNVRRLNNESVRDLIALLWRYGVQLKPLAEIAATRRFSWLNDPEWYWSQSMFEEGAPHAQSDDKV